MKILELRFKNLNSLYGEWLIDFSDAEYTANGIFALIGPTGAGKSTVLDAICLALYGATPRLGKITQNSNEIMSRQTGECYAEVLFQTHDGQYRAHWQQRRARKRIDGALQSPIHEIIDASSEQIIESKKSLVAGVIEEKTGMDFERFTRAILLAQGGFDTFLKADIEQKSTILEQITGTDVYSEISIKVFERHRKEQQQLDLLQAKAEGVTLLTAEAEEATLQAQTTLDERLQQLNGQNSQLHSQLQWLQTIADLEQSLAQLHKQKRALEGEQAAFAPAQAKLARAQQAASIEGTYIAYEQLRRQRQKEQALVRTCQQSLPTLEAALVEKKRSLDAKQEKLEQAQQILTDKRPVLKTVRALDVSLGEKQLDLKRLNDELVEEESAIKAWQTELRKLERQQEDVAQSVADISQYEQAHEHDENLLFEYSAIEALYQDWQSQVKEVAHEQARYKDKKQELEKAQEQLTPTSALTQLQEEEENISDTLAKKTAQHEALLNGQTLSAQRQQIEQLQSQAQHLAMVASLEQQRQALQDGEPCPLCGAREHPYAHQNVGQDTSGLNAQIKKLQTTVKSIEALEDEISDLKEQLYLAASTYKQCQQQHEQQNTHIQYLQNNLNEQQQALERYQSRAKTQQEDLANRIAVFHLDLDFDDLEAGAKAMHVLAQRLQHWQDNAHKKQKLGSQLQALNNQQTQVQARINLYRQTCAKKKEALVQLQSQCQQKQNQRTALLNKDNPDEVEAQLEQNITHAQQAVNEARQRLQQSEHDLKAARQQIKDKQQQLEDEEKIFIEKESIFINRLAQKSFANEQDFLQARLDEATLETLSQQVQHLKERQALLDAQQMRLQEQLITLKKEALTEQSLAQVQHYLAELEREIEAVKEERNKLAFRLEANEQAKVELKTQYVAIEKQRLECQRWHELNELVGSSDGKKYRSFAQGLTFEVMVGHANRQLAKMTDRYWLLRDTQSPLTLNVVDFYQASTVRSIKNLSGGESFMVSLALALGLSTMASRKVQIDSLFLDEGFGTLDEQALDTALTMLSELQQEGKLIGIISHVAALKERIATQIKVMPISHGKSRLQGPGCVRL